MTAVSHLLLFRWPRKSESGFAAATPRLLILPVLKKTPGWCYTILVQLLIGLTLAIDWPSYHKHILLCSRLPELHSPLIELDGYNCKRHNAKCNKNWPREMAKKQLQLQHKSLESCTANCTNFSLETFYIENILFSQFIKTEVYYITKSMKNFSFINFLNYQDYFIVESWCLARH